MNLSEKKKKSIIEDIEILGKVVRKEVLVDELDDELVKRLVVLCKYRLSTINKKIEQEKAYIKKLES